MDSPKIILILGGTGEARKLAGGLVALGHDVTSSLAGRTQSPLLPEGRVRIGGFGGANGLADFLRAGRFTHMVDATHPFAAQISANAVAASASTGVRLLRLERPAWECPEGAEWIEVSSIGEAAARLPAGAKVLLTIGRQEVDAFAGRHDCHFVARVIDAPGMVPTHWTVLKARGPFALNDEIELMRTHGISHVVSKNSGGAQAAAKLTAAATLGLQVVMVRRPAPPEARTVADIEAAIAWVEG